MWLVERKYSRMAGLFPVIWNLGETFDRAVAHRNPEALTHKSLKEGSQGNATGP